MSSSVHIEPNSTPLTLSHICAWPLPKLLAHSLPGKKPAQPLLSLLCQSSGHAPSCSRFPSLPISHSSSSAAHTWLDRSLPRSSSNRLRLSLLHKINFIYISSNSSPFFVTGCVFNCFVNYILLLCHNFYNHPSMKGCLGDSRFQYSK